MFIIGNLVFDLEIAKIVKSKGGWINTFLDIQFQLEKSGAVLIDYFHRV